MGKLKTVLLMVGLVLLFVYVGDLVGGEQGMWVAFLMACGLNFFSYFFSDKLVLNQYKAQEVNVVSAPVLYRIVKRLAMKADLPMPRVYIIPDSIPNAFATGRNPAHAAVAATQGLLDMMSEEEIEGVMAHEMTHVRNYDILTGTIAAAFAGAITILARSIGYGTSSRNSRSSGGTNLFSFILFPIAASIVQMSISRTREYAADKGSAELTHHPDWLISALKKLELYSARNVMKNASPNTAHMFIISPFGNLKSNFSSLFSTHPSTKDRIEHLEKIRKSLR